MTTADMATHQYLSWMLALTGFFFIFALGSIVGSFLNVVVYRLPRGLNIVSPPSSCPSCGTTLTWRENFPIFGWLALGGRCRFCRSKISAEYPLIELLVALLFVGVFTLWFMRPSIVEVIGINASWFTPAWAHDGLARMWPMFMQVLVLIAALVAITLIDARTFTIPLSIPWLVIVLALVTHPLHALAISATRLGGLLDSEHWVWTIPTPEPGSGWFGATIGGTLGLAMSIVLLHFKLMPRSFADYPEWEKAHQAELQAQQAAAESSTASTPSSGDIPFRVIMVRTLLLTGPALALMFGGFSIGLRIGKPMPGMLVGMLTGLVIGIVLRRLVADRGMPEEPVWVQYPHARREMFKELLFLAPCMALAAIGHTLTAAGGPWFCGSVPLWLDALAGSLLGLLVGGGIVWGIRILGSLTFGKEAMGLGDVHLMAAVGAVLGWIDPVLAFFTAPFFGIGWAVMGLCFGRLLGRVGTALPFGPHLAAATVLVIYLKPVFEVVLSAIMNRPIDLP